MNVQVSPISVCIGFEKSYYYLTSSSWGIVYYKHVFSEILLEGSLRTLAVI